MLWKKLEEFPELSMEYHQMFAHVSDILTKKAQKVFVAPNFILFDTNNGGVQCQVPSISIPMGKTIIKSNIKIHVCRAYFL